MENVIYLSPGFFITINPEGKIILVQMPIELRRGNPARLAVIDAYCNGYQGSVEDLITDAAHRFNGNADNLRDLVKHLEEEGCLTNAVPTPHPTNNPSFKSGAVAGPGDLTITTPVSLLAEGGKYLWYNHKGQLLARLSLSEVRVAAMFCKPITAQLVRTQYFHSDQPDGLDEAKFDALLSHLAQAGILTANTHDERQDDAPATAAPDRAKKLQAAIDDIVAAHDEAAGVVSDRMSVIPVNTDHNTTPAALGMLVAYAMKYDKGRLGDVYNFVPLFLADADRLIERASRPGIFLFSNYIWTVDGNLKLSAAIKAANPANVTIHGGPSTPKYDKDAEDFFADHSHVDIIVRGEGELTLAEILDALDPANPLNLGPLQHVPGLSYRTNGEVCRTADRERIADLDTIPSPYLMGLFDAFGNSRTGAIIETNRGCPYGCTFCDWGSATLTRIRRFDLDRVFQEIEWCAERHIETASIADANFGMLDRNVAIAEKIAEMKLAHGYPRTVAVNYAKNNVKYLRTIIDILAKAEILTEGLVSLQSMDETTLKVIDRSNIKLDKYNELSTEFRRAGLPLAADIMMGLPGSTPAAFSSDLQECTDRDVRVRANLTLLLPNSPMNDPSYRKEHGIVAKPGEILKEAATYTREEWDDMNGLREAFYIFDTWGLLRYVGRHVRRVTGMGEVKFYDGLRSEVLRHPRDWPIIATVLKTMEQHMAPPGSWGLFVNEVRRYLVDQLGVPDDSALQTTLNVQLAHLPASDRSFPEVLELEHDYMAWQDELLNAREAGHRDDWQDHIPQLSEFGPATLTIHDPNDICRHDVGKPMGVLAYSLRSWEMDSPVARPRLGSATAG